MMNVKNKKWNNPECEKMNECCIKMTYPWFASNSSVFSVVNYSLQNFPSFMQTEKLVN